MSFQAQVNQQILINGVTYRVAEHPAAPGTPYGQEGRAATVYQLVADTEHCALKVFKPRYRLPALVTLAGQLAAFATLPGLSVCNRTVLTPQRHSALLRQYTDLTYAVLMPWIEGPTWMEVLLEKRELTAEQSLTLARLLVEILSMMEQRGVAHCDLCGPNVLLPALVQSTTSNAASAIALVDVEQLYGPGLARPAVLPGGSPGYAHRIAPDGQWGSNSDRFAGAVAVAEMLGWCDGRVRNASWGENYFDPAEMQQDTERYRVLMIVLYEWWGKDVARLFERAWYSETLADCATFGEWLVSLPETVPVILHLSPPQVEVEHGVKTETNPESDLVLAQRAAEFGLVEPDSSRAREEAELMHLFTDGLVAYQCGEWLAAKELLNSVVAQRPDYECDGKMARSLLAETELQLVPSLQRLLKQNWVLAGLGVLFVAILIGITSTVWAWVEGVPPAAVLPTATEAVVATAESLPTATPTPEPTNTPLPTQTLTPSPTPTRTPMSYTDPLLYDNFNDPAFDGACNLTLWSFHSGGVFEAKQQNGVMVFSNSAASSSGGAELNISQPTKRSLQQLQLFEARLKVSSDHRGKYAFVKIQITADVSGHGWWTQCRLGSWSGGGNPQFICDIATDSGDKINFEYVTKGIPSAYDMWYSARIEADPRTANLRFYLNNTLVGSHTPADAAALTTANNLQPSVGVWNDGADTYATRYVDDVRITFVQP